MVELALQREPPFFTLHDERRVATRVRESASALEVHNVISEGVQKGPIVTDTQHRPINHLEVLLQPRRGVEIKMIRGFVKNHQVGRHRQLTRQRHASAFSTTQRANARHARRLGIEAHTHQHTVHLRRHLIAAVSFEPLKIVAVPLHRDLAVIVLEIGRLRRQRALQLAERTEGVGNDVPQHLLFGKTPMLIHQRHTQTRRARHRTTRWQEIAREQSNQSGLAGTVASHDRPSIVLGNSDRDIAKNFAGAEFDNGIADRNQRHATLVIIRKTIFISETITTTTKKEKEHRCACKPPAHDRRRRESLRDRPPTSAEHERGAASRQPHRATRGPDRQAAGAA